jgi:hypothetical protein
MEKVTIRLRSRQRRWVQSRAFSFIAMWRGVAASFAPLFLYASGRESFLTLGPTWVHEWIVVPLCFLIILAVQWTYQRLADPVIEALHEQSRNAARARKTLQRNAGRSQ